MTDNSNKLTPPPLADHLAKRHKIGLSNLHNKINQAQQAEANRDALASSAPNRLGLMLDGSSSMNEPGEPLSGMRYYRNLGSSSKNKIELLREAMQSFVASTNFNDTSLAMETFPSDEKTRLPLTQFEPIVSTTIMTLQAAGGTPMAGAMEFMLNSYSLTRGIIVSDGEADVEHLCIEQAGNYREAGIPIDCVHIGQSTQGEHLLKNIAEMTGGIYIKFKDVQTFAKNFSYLTPAGRDALMLHDGSERAKLLGAEEVK